MAGTAIYGTLAMLTGLMAAIGADPSTGSGMAAHLSWVRGQAQAPVHNPIAGTRRPAADSHVHIGGDRGLGRSYISEKRTAAARREPKHRPGA
jgi:hypothetical protein